MSGRRARKGDALVGGEEVVALLEPAGRSPEPQPSLSLVIWYEDPDLAVVEKPGGWPIHPLRSGETGTLANAVVARWPECGEASPDPREGGVAHRLDTPTSGLVVVARNRKAWDSLRAQFASRTVHKEYLALVAGRYEGPGIIDTPIAADRSRTGRMVAVTDPARWERTGAREAHTRVSVDRVFSGYTLVRCVITTGVMHQIRVHLAHVGHPVAGDDRYGNPDDPPGIPRLFLHATVLAFDHPVSGERLVFHSPLPAELEAVLKTLT